MTNLLHDIEPGTKDHINVIVEIPRGSRNKFEIDKETGIIALDRAMSSSQDYPFDYGFIPQTLWDDGDALDVVLLTTFPLLPGILVRARPVAIMNVVDSGDKDDKIIAVPADDPRWNDVEGLDDLSKHTLNEIAHFFETYKMLEKKEVTVSGFKGRSDAELAFERSKQLYIDNK